MAEYGKIVMKKLSGGVLNVTATDGATSTDLVLPLSGTVAINEYISKCLEIKVKYPKESKC